MKFVICVLPVALFVVWITWFAQLDMLTSIVLGVVLGTAAGTLAGAWENA